ncbi:GDP-L-fucose synthase [Candidatus Pelagibacter sp.]|nr:GDP-L-fucose synthase [Candidatus Pelagibacter sp.]
MDNKKKIFLAGHNGMVGSAIYKKLKLNGYKNILVRSRKELDLLNQSKTFKFLRKNKPYYVILAAAKVGGIKDNAKNKDKYIYENLQIQNNIIHGSYLAGIKNLFLLGSSCIYPKHCKQPMKEKYILSGPLEETNDAYSIAKIAGLKMCEYYSKIHNLNFKCIMPPNLYGPNDNFDLETSHFYPALIKKIYLSKLNNKKKLDIWGTGKAKRELMFVEDFADAILFFMKKKIKQPFINIGTGKEHSILWYAKYLMKKMKVNLKVQFDKSKPDGMPHKCLDISIAKQYGWKPIGNLDKGFKITFNHFKKQI